MITRISLLLLLIIGLISCSGDDDSPEETPIYLSALSGDFTAETIMSYADGGPNLSCQNGIWYGNVQLVAQHTEGVDTVGIYQVFSANTGTSFLEDPSMGGYYDCYSVTPDDPDLLPNGDNGEGSLLLIDDDGILSWQGISQWGEVYFMDEVSPDGVVLTLDFQNDYGEVFEVRLIRNNGTNWPETLRAE